MYVVVNTFYALPGKFSELINVLHEASAFGKKINGIESIVLLPVSGKLNEVKIRWEVETLSQHEEHLKKTLGHPEFAALSEKLVALLVPNTSHSDIYRQV
jgi:hypothetical protein